MTSSSATYLRDIHRLLDRNFNLEEIRTLCFYLNVDYESMPGTEKQSQIRELLLALGRSSRLSELASLAQQQRPLVAWPSMPDNFQFPTSLISCDMTNSSDPIDYYGDIVQNDKVEGDKIGGDKIQTQTYIDRQVIVQGVEITDIEQLRPEEGYPPYKGLTYFTEEDADWFFGQEAATALLINRLHELNFLAVLGDSGSGKSSLVRAGVIPIIKRDKILADGTLPPLGIWKVYTLTPTAHPLAKLIDTLFPNDYAKQAVIAEKAHKNSDALRLALETQLQEAGYKLLLFVDQFEELFTLCKKKNEQEVFITNLLAAAHESCKIIITLRADFYAHCLHYDGLREILKIGQEPLGAMTSQGLMEAILEPAAKGNWQFQEGLVEVILEDVGQEPGALPLLSHALHETWKHRRGRIMTLSGYRQANGVRGAITKTADTIYKHLTKDQKDIARYIFLRLTEIGEAIPETRRIVAHNELVLSNAEVSDIDFVLQTLIKARLIIVREMKTEMAHEALIQNWSRLRGWLDEDREALVVHQRLMEAARDWNAHGKDKSYLAVGKKLEVIEITLVKFESRLNILEKEFVEASRRKARYGEIIKRFGIVFFVIILLTVFVMSVFQIPPFDPAWQWFGGPIGGSPWKMLIAPTKPETIFVGNSNQGVFKSEDGGFTWDPANTGLGDKLIGAINIDPLNTNVLYASAGTDGVFISSDFGENWRPINNGLPLSVLARSLVVLEGPSSELFLATWGDGIWSTPSSEINWKQIAQGEEISPYILTMEVGVGDPTIIYISTSHQGLFRSVDFGLTWELIGFSGEDVTEIELVPWDRDAIYVTGPIIGPHMSLDGGLTWSSIADNFDAPPRSGFTLNQNNGIKAIYLGTLNGLVYRLSEGNNEHWEPVWSNLPLAFIRDIDFLSSSNTILISTSNGIYLSEDVGESWQLTGPTILRTEDISGLMMDHSILALTNNGAYKVSIGQGWKAVNSGLQDLDLSHLASMPEASEQTAYAVSGSGSLYHYSDDENRWQELNSPSSKKVVLANSTFGKPEKIYAVMENNYLYESNNYGQTWNLLWQFSDRPTVILASSVLGEEIFVGTSISGIYKSTDGGVSWQEANQGITNPSVNDLVIAPLVKGLLYAATDDGVFVSKNGGETWDHSIAGLSNRQIISLAIHPYHSGTVYAGSPGGVFVSYDFGATWHELEKGLPIHNVLAVYADVAYVYIGTGNGVYYRKHALPPATFWHEWFQISK